MTIAVLVQVIAFTLNECIILGLMKDVPQELTIAYNVGKSAANFSFVLCWIALAMYGSDTIVYWFFAALLPIPVFMCSRWFTHIIRSHKQNLNVFKVLETKEVLDDKNMEDPDTEQRK